MLPRNGINLNSSNKPNVVTVFHCVAWAFMWNWFWQTTAMVCTPLKFQRDTLVEHFDLFAQNYTCPVFGTNSIRFFVVIYSLEMFVKNCTLTILIPWWSPYQPTDSIHWTSIFFSIISFYVSKFKSKFSSISLAFMYNTYVT